MEISESLPVASTARFRPLDVVSLWLGLGGWVATFLLGTIVDSRPYRATLASLDGGIAGIVRTGSVVVFTYTLTNVAVLCLLAGLLGTLGTKVRLCSDSEDTEGGDGSSPNSSALLRGFLVYLFVIAGLLFLGDDPIAPSQQQYVRLAGLVSLLGFIINYRPALFAKLLRRAGALVEGGQEKKS